MLTRTEVIDEEDLNNVHMIQNSMELKPYGEYTSEEKKIKSFIPVEEVLGYSAEEFFNLANKLMDKNPPSDEDSEIIDEMKKLNIGAGLEFDISVLGDDYEEKWSDMKDKLVGYLEGDVKEFIVSNGAWEFFGEPIAEFGTEYAYRAIVAIEGLGANPVLWDKKKELSGISIRL